MSCIQGSSVTAATAQTSSASPGMLKNEMSWSEFPTNMKQNQRFYLILTCVTHLFWMGSGYVGDIAKCWPKRGFWKDNQRLQGEKFNQ